MAIENQPALASNLMTFYDNYETPLPAGAYRFVLQQTVSVGGEQPVHYYRDQAFEVVAPRYVIEESEIQAYFPPQGGVADYQNILPHLVLRTRNLPWERAVWADSGREPWLVLLMLSEQDVLEGQAAAKVGTVADLKPQQQTSTHRSRTENGAAILLPEFIRDDDPQTPVRLLDLDLKLFLKLCPRREELPMLAHIRRVDTANKVPLEMAADGEFSVLVGNRFPSQGANTIYLISLEGWSDLIDADAEQSHPASRLRLIILGSWNFVSDPAGNDTFGGLMRRLRDKAAVFGVKPPASGHAYVNQALARGYVPLDYQPLNSTQTFAWYRGPLAPLAVKQRKQQAFERADAALIFDEQTAVMDVSYAAAWQLGRLLALASPAFSKGLRLFVERYQNALGFADEIANFVNLHRSSFTDLKPDNTEPVNEQIAIADDLVRWIAQLVLLYPVPFHYLVPHPALLPPESLRFFHLDDNWVDALVDGALSIAVRSLADQGVASRADLQSALSKIVYQYRLRLQGKQPKWDPSEQYMSTPKSGFLLRSSIVTGWPGVEVTATTIALKDPDLPEILRMDKIADGVLFCLARGSLKQLSFREPREGLTFGVDSDGAIKARKSGKTLNIKKDLLRADSRDGVANIAALRRQLAQAEALNEASFGSAEFAAQMIRMPEEQIIEWS
ncbi:MAG TPA: hypothetical protein VJX74_00295 [Blastocatellia bacterium]|nr:hypothetical protein [Blastocatellia bacterium]